jgi:anti-sigma regulatory factor (Ser/Thr protein kinase)
MTARATLQLVGPMEHLRLVWQAGEALLEPVLFDEDPEGTRYNILLAVQEMLTNVLRHGYNRDENHPIEVSFQVEDDAIGVEMRDRGPAFDPLQHDTSAVEEDSGMPDSAGGFGIHIAKMVMDSLDYRRDGEWNVLTMAKFVRSGAIVGTESQGEA